MSKKNRAQHKGANKGLNFGSTPRRQGDRNVQTRYSKKHLPEETDRKNPGCQEDVETAEAVETVETVASKNQSKNQSKIVSGIESLAAVILLEDIGFPGLCAAPELKIKINELHIHKSEQTNHVHFYDGGRAVFQSVDDESDDRDDTDDANDANETEDSDEEDEYGSEENG